MKLLFGYTILFVTRDILPRFVIITCPNLRKKWALWPQSLWADW